ncbi:MAG TPA: hypothetical protein VMH85_09545 [Terriglobales bacterium]|nr:hypothetical protein [Terriglobales bacterium]
MLHKCANPNCASPFRRLDEGKLFQVEIEPSSYAVLARGVSLRKTRTSRQVERFWLCDKCSSLLTLTFVRGRGVVAVPLPGAGQRSTAVPNFHELPHAAREVRLANLVAQH